MLKKIFYIILILLGGVGIAATINSVFMSTSVSIGTVLPGAAGIIFITYALIHILRPGNIIRIKPLRITVMIIVCLGILSFAAVEAIIIAYENTCRADEKANFVIVPGCGIFPDGRLTLTLKDRLDTACGYIQQHKNTICIVSGGKGKNEPFPEAQGMKEYLVLKGISPSMIIEEPDSHDTLENMAYCSEIMDRLFPGKEKTAVVVTSGFHVFRALLLANNNGIKASGISAPIPWYLAINDYMREYIGVLHTAVFELK
jgi:uncharacterized SAM-binding protein YcdF (DUF218 family)